MIRLYVSRLPFGQNISSGRFRYFGSWFGILEVNGVGQWADRGRGFIGFRFNNGAGPQYGWARIFTSGVPEAKIRLVDYAYADPGEPIRAGQKSSHEMVPGEGSLGWLAIGAAGTCRLAEEPVANRPVRKRLSRTSLSKLAEAPKHLGLLSPSPALPNPTKCAFMPVPAFTNDDAARRRSHR